MKKSLNTSIIIALTILFSAQFLCANNSNNTTEIPQSGIKRLVIEFNSIKIRQSATRLRRAYKSVVRKAETLIYIDKAKYRERRVQESLSSVRADEAKAEWQLAANETRPHPLTYGGIERAGVPVGVFYDRMKRIRLALAAEVKRHRVLSRE